MGLRVAIRADDSCFTTDDALILEVPPTMTFKVPNVGSDLAATADTGSVMLIEAGLSTGSLTDGTPFDGITRIADMDEYTAVVNAGSTAAGASAQWTLTVQRADTGHYVVEAIGL